MPLAKQVFFPRDDVRWLPVFEFEQRLGYVELDFWETPDGLEGDLTVFYADSAEPFPIRSLREGRLKELLYECWATAAPELFE